MDALRLPLNNQFGICEKLTSHAVPEIGLLRPNKILSLVRIIGNYLVLLTIEEEAIP